jgi:uncharacterized membrane protein YbhN (UPF0104 family)
VNLALAALLVALAVVATVALMLYLRRRAPDGSWFTDGTRASAVFGFLGTAFVVLLGFVTLLAFESYSNAKAKAEDEAAATLELFESTELFPTAEQNELEGYVVCYARAVVGDEWRTMRDGARSRLVDTWALRMAGALRRVGVRGRQASTAFDKWFEESDVRERGRRERLLEGHSVIPPLFWTMLILGGTILVGYICLFADRGESALVQATFMGGVTAMVVISLLGVRLLDHPYGGASGSIKPTSMRYSLDLMRKEGSRIHETAPPCDHVGRPRPA